MNHQDTLLHLLRSSDPAPAVEELFESYADRVYQLALGMLGDPSQAEDIVQETFLIILDKRMQFEGRADISTWIYRIAYNATINKLRQKTTETLPVEEHNREDENHTVPLPKSFINWEYTPEILLSNAETRQQLNKAITKLSPALYSVFILRDILELSSEQTAEVLGISLSAVKVRLHRARLELRETLAGYFDERLKGVEK